MRSVSYLATAGCSELRLLQSISTDTSLSATYRAIYSLDHTMEKVIGHFDQ